MSRTIPLIVGNPVLVVVDMQRGAGQPADVVGIAMMGGNDGRVAKAQRLVAAARAADIPIVFFQEVHRPSGIDFGRELDGNETEHCIDGHASTELEDVLRPSGDDAKEFHIVKRRYSGFIGTEFEIILRALRADTLFLIGGLTDVCVHYTFADAHQRDFHVRVVEDCVGGSNEARHAASLDAMEYLQHGARQTTDAIEAAFLERATGSATDSVAAADALVGASS